MIEFDIAGHSVKGLEADAGQGDLGITVSVKETVLVAAGRGTGDTATVAASDDDLVEIGLEGGSTLWIRADELESQIGTAGSRGGDTTGPLTIGAALPLDDRSRGVGSWAIDGLRVLGIDLAGKAASDIAEAFEKKAVPDPGLYKWDGSTLLPFDGLADEGKPWLLFLHGTGSNTAAGFGDLPRLQHGPWKALRDQYGDRILAFEHPTLTHSPVANALDLVRRLPQGIELHLVSHSRGGLVGELLGRGRLTDLSGQPRPPFDRDEIQLFESEGYEAQRLELVALNEALSTNPPKVTRFVRVAAPARGTSLMGGRIDRWLNLVFNVASLSLGGRLNPIARELLEGLRALVQATVKERTDPTTLPGLAAMSPEFSPLLQVLNRKQARQQDDLQVIAGDIEPGGVLRRLAVWFADLYFGDDHDLVVDTGSMDGGTPRQKAPAVFVDRGESVSHFNYFANASSARLLESALTGKAGATETAADLHRAAQSPMPELTHRGAGDLSIAFVLPGITGSHLKVGTDRIWIDIFGLARGQFSELDIHNLEVEADEPVSLYYGKLCRYLNESHEVRPWAYDWRHSILETARRFGRDLHAALGETNRSVRIVAHSMGGLVARTAFALDPDLWKRFRSREGCRLVMLGTPNGGSFSIPMLLFGRDKLMRYLALLDLTAGPLDQLKIVSAWPGVLQMLPANEADLFTTAGWKRLKKADPGLDFPLPAQAALDQAREFRQLFEKAPSDAGCMFYIAGQGDTYAELTEDATAPAGQRLGFTVSRAGDGQVLWESGIPKEVKAWYTNAVHGDLPRHDPVLPAILDLLQTGATDRLPDRPPVVAPPRGEAERVVRESVAMVPSETQLLAAAMGSNVLPTVAERRKVGIRVRHGHLAFASYPVLVGHYLGDTLNGTELVLDRRQGGRISKRRALGIHPGAIETCDVFIDREMKPQGSVVVGLGETSQLTRGRLERTVRRGLLDLAATRQEYDEYRRRNNVEGFESMPRGVTCILVGSGEGVVALEDCVTAILLAVQQANRILDDQAAYQFLEIIEVVEQVAVNAWHAIRGRIERAEFRDAFVLEGKVERSKGAWRRIGPDRDPSWWTPITITAAAETPDDMVDAGSPRNSDSRPLKYVVIAGRARAEATLVATRRCLVDRYLERVMRTRVETGPMAAGRTLFELLWPNRLKEQSLDDRNIRLILDEDAAALPWEMMDDRRPWEVSSESNRDPGHGPPAVRAGVVRQLISQRVRETVTTARGRKRALVVGDPRGEASGLRELPGAQDEARAVQAVLEAHGYEVTALIGDRWRPEDVVSALFGDAWQIVHIAAHGVVDHVFPDDPCSDPRTGVVLGGSMVIDAEMLEQMPVVPDLFFVNCCLLGSIEPDEESAYLRADRPALASSVAVQLIRMGVRAVIAAGWEVSDDVAKRFAEAVYRGLLERRSFGDLLRDARAEAYQNFPSNSAWGAYQCYGEPDFRLPGGQPAERHPDRLPEFALPGEAISIIERIAAMADVGGERDTAADLAELGRVEEAVVAHGWKGRADIRSALAVAYAQLKRFDRAIDHYAYAAVCEDATLPVKAVEQRLNLLVRRDASAPDAKSGDGSAASRVRESIRALEMLAQACGKTLERLSLIGSGYKRLARIVEGDERTEALEKMQRSYANAREIGQASELNEVFYPWSQELAAEIVIALRRAKKRVPRPKDLREIRKLVRPESEDFWLQILSADLDMLERVADARIDEGDRATLKEAYTRVWRHTGSSREASSVVDQITFFVAMLDEEVLQKDPRLKRLTRSLRTLSNDIIQEIEA